VLTDSWGTDLSLSCDAEVQMASSRSGAAPPEYGDFIDALQRARARSRDTAVSRADLPTIPVEHLDVFLGADIIREGAPGTYYLTTSEERASKLARPLPPFTPLRVTLMMAVWVVMIALPFVVWLIAR
jgi:hypothetical protein